VAGEVTIPILPCPDLDEALAFYTSLGFATTYRQLRPNPYAVVRREDLELHLAGIPGFDPQNSYASAIVVVPDAEALHREFAGGLRAARGRVPLSGIPRLLRPRKKAGTVAGFTMVDVGGNWLRFYRAGDTEDDHDRSVSGLARVLMGAARQGDSHGDEATAAQMLDRGLARHANAPAVQRVEAMIYRAELALRLDDHEHARRLLDDVEQIELSADETAALAEPLSNAEELRGQLTGG
jgi:catechol 2,3-dioxygenase-like lactoylglutathione lyase family enzyme